MSPEPLPDWSTPELQPRISPRAVLTLLVLLLVSTSPAAAGLDRTTETGVADTLDRSPAPTALFDAETYEDHRGDVVEFAVSLDGGDAATVRVRGSDYEATVVLQDEDGDGSVTASFNTYLAGRDGRTFAAAGDDSATVRNESWIDGLPAAGTYDLSVATGEDVEDTATLHLRERSTEGLTIWSALDSERSKLTDLEGILAARRSRTLHRADHVTERDVLVLEIQSSGLSGALAAQDGPNATARFFELLDDPRAAFDDPDAGIALAASQDVATVNTHEDPVLLDFAAHHATTVVPDVANDTYYVVVVDIDAARRVTGDGELDPGEIFDVQFVVGNGSSLANGDREVARDDVMIVPRSASVDGADPIYLDPEPNRTISGRTNVPPGYPVTVTVYAPGEVDFERTKEVTVGPDGGFEVTVDLDEVPERTRFGVRVTFRGRTLFEDDEVGYVERIPADVDVLDVRNEGFVAVDVNATLGLGGFVILHANDSDGRVVGRSKYLPPGSHNVTAVAPRLSSDVRKISVVLYRDDDDDGRFGLQPPFGDSPYRDDGSPVNATVKVPPPESPTPSPSPTQTRTPTATPTQSDTPSPATATTTRPTGTDTTVPGFGMLPTLASLLGAALVARRAVGQR